MGARAFGGKDMSTSSVQKTLSTSSGKELEKRPALVGMYGRKEMPIADMDGMGIELHSNSVGSFECVLQ